MSLTPKPARAIALIALATIFIVTACSGSDDDGAPQRSAGTETRLFSIDTDAWIEGSFVGSPDRRHAAYIIVDDADLRVAVLDGTRKKGYKRMGDLRFSPDSRRLSYVGQRDDELHYLAISDTTSFWSKNGSGSPRHFSR
jgi:hypothetical protein